MDDEAVGGAAGYDDNKMILQHHQSWSGATTIATNFSPLFFPFFAAKFVGISNLLNSLDSKNQ